MEDKLFELMEKMYNEVIGIKDDINDINSKLTGLETEVKKTNAIIEGEVMPKIEALFDGYKQNTETLTDLKADVSIIRRELEVVNMKTTHNANKIEKLSKKAL